MSLAAQQMQWVSHERGLVESASSALPDVSQRLVWSPKLSVGHPLLDEQHKKLLLLIHRVEDLLENLDDHRSYHAALNDLYTASREHFKTEEMLLERSGYPDFEEHKAEHQLQLDQITEFLIAAIKGRLDRYQLHQSLTRFWHEHLPTRDMDYAPYLK